MILDGMLSVLANPACLIWILVGTLVGILFGAIPGLTATMAIAMFLPVTYNMDPIVGISLLVSLYIGGISGGLIPAILINIPGTPASIATTFDGRPMAINGQAGKALGGAIVFSFVGTLMGVLALVTISPPLAAIAIKFGPFEYTAITIFSLTLIITLSSQSLTKGLISGILGLIFATVGMAPIDSVPRFTLGLINLRSGFDILTVMVGVYAISELFSTAEDVKNESEHVSLTNDAKVKIKGFGLSIKEFVGQIPNAIRSSFIGILLGILPGIGAGTSNILSYSIAKNQSKHPEKFGTGILDGVVASETANNATIGGTIIPLLTLGIPGDSTSALLLGALIIQGITPGPLIFQQNGVVVYSIYIAMVLSSLVTLIASLFGINVFVKLLKIPKSYLISMVFVLCCVGAYGLNNQVFDMFSLLGFGILGYVLNKAGFPLPPLILGFVLGPIFELNFRRALSYSQGNLIPFVTSPISLVFLILAIVSIVLGIYKKHKDAIQGV